MNYFICNNTDIKHNNATGYYVGRGPELIDQAQASTIEGPREGSIEGSREGSI